MTNQERERLEQIAGEVRKIAEYLGAMTERNKVTGPETRCARVENRIRNAMLSRRRITVRELKQLTARRVATRDWERAFENLCSEGEIRVDTEPTGKKTVILLKTCA